MTTSKTLTIFEGVDGSGKSTAAKAYAAEIGARYVHCGPFLGIGDAQLGRFYAELMMPAVMGYEPVVLDRSWISEAIYGTVHRNHDRVAIGARLLERLAWRCGAVLVHCHPPYEVALRNWAGRKGEEYLQQEQSLRRVYAGYQAGLDLVPLSSLSTVVYDYQERGADLDLSTCIDRVRGVCHPLDQATAGNFKARVLVVGEKFAELTNADPAYQWPFGSFSGGGCSRWLAARLEEADVGEDRLLWANADMDLGRVIACWDATRTAHGRYLVALGDQAAAALYAVGERDFHTCQHPQFHKRFRAREAYPLVNLLKELT